MKDMTPKVFIDGQSGSGTDPKSIFQAAADAFRKGGLATQPPNIEGEYDAAKREQKAKEDDRIADAIATLRQQRQKQQLAHEQNNLKFYKDMALLQLPLMRPGSPWGIAFAARGVSQGLLGTQKGRGLMGAFGLSGAGGAMLGATALVAGAVAIGTAFVALKKIVDETAKAYENARQLYAKSLQSGLGLKFTTQRSLIAQVMGVSETEVFRFGAQMAYLNPRLAQASKILAETAIPLTQVSWEFKILKTDLAATFASLANDAAPALLNFTKAVDGLLQMLNRHKTLLKNLGDLGATLLTGGQSQWLKWFTHARVANETGASMPGPSSWMKQLPASAWEHMGLGIAGGGQNYQRETAKNTAKLVQILTRKMDGPIQGPHWNMPAFGNTL
jgi:hypothetical protein